jgi:hypothetical protein
MKQFYTKPLAPRTPNESASIPEPSPTSLVDKLFGGTELLMEIGHIDRVCENIKSRLVPAGGGPAPLSPSFSTVDAEQTKVKHAFEHLDVSLEKLRRITIRVLL